MKWILKKILDGFVKKEVEPEVRTHPCPACGEETERYDRCTNDDCRVTFFYQSGICFYQTEVDESEEYYVISN